MATQTITLLAYHQTITLDDVREWHPHWFASAPTQRGHVGQVEGSCPQGVWFVSSEVFDYPDRARRYTVRFCQFASTDGTSGGTLGTAAGFKLGQFTTRKQAVAAARHAASVVQQAAHFLPATRRS